MGGGKEVSLDIQEVIVREIQSGKKKKDLATQFNLNPSTITRIHKRFLTAKTIRKTPRSGRPKKTTPRHDKIIMRMSKKYPHKTSADIHRDLVRFYGLNASRETVRRRLTSNGLFGRRPCKKPLVSPKNRKARIEFAKKHIGWTIDQWKNVLFSDESKFNLFGSDGNQYVRRPVNTRFVQKYQKPTVKHGGGSVLVWSCFSLSGVGPLHRINGIMDAQKYKEILKNTMLPFARRNMPRKWIYQQDNDPKHTSKLVKNVFSSKKVCVMQWPSQSPDLNPIEHLWEELGRRVGHIRVRNADEKFNVLSREWETIPKEKIEKLIESMPRRCKAVIDSLGYPTKY